MGLPPKRVLLSHRYRVRPRSVRMAAWSGSAGAARAAQGGCGHGGGRPRRCVTFAGTGFAGIRPGAFLLLINDGSIGWCSMAHVYGSPGGYSVSTAGHCGKPATSAP